MDSDSESQDSDEGRRFRFETTRKDAASLSQSRRKVSPQRSRTTERRSRSRDRSAREERSRHSKDDRRSRSSNERDSISSRHSTKDRSSKNSKSSGKDSSSRRQHNKDSRSHRTKDSRDYDSRESRDNRDHSNNKHKSKSREKHKRRSRDRSRERSSQSSAVEEVPIKEEKKTDSDTPPISMETEEIKPEKQKSVKRQRAEDSEKVNDKSVDKANLSGDNNPIAVSDILLSRTTKSSTTIDATPTRKKPKSFFDRVVNKKNDNDDSSIYGPALPPALEKKMLNAREAESETENIVEIVKTASSSVVDDTERTIGPILPENLGLSTKQEDDSSSSKEMEEEEKAKEEEEEEDDEGAFGPSLPPHMQRREVVGPMLPENFVVNSDTNNTVKSSKSDDEDDDNDIVGPLPPDHPNAQDNYVQMQLEYRARQVKAKFRDKTSPEKNKREEWMVELPPAHAVALGLGSIPRKFKTSEGPDMSDRSIWTDTPADRLRKQKEKEENRFVPEESSKKSKKCKNKDVVEEHVEEKSESLLDMHLKTIKKKKKKLEKEAKALGLPTRRPFDRDIDLQVNRLDDARKKKIFEKASRLNDRFTVGKI